MHMLDGMVAPKTRITMLLDSEVLAFFKARARRRGAEPYQTQINRILREYASGLDPSLSEAVRRVAERMARYRAPSPGPEKPRRPKSREAARPPSLQRTLKVVARAGEESGWVAECVELPIVTQGRTLDELAANLREAVALHLAHEDTEALGLVPDPAIVVTLELPVAHA